MSIKASAGNRVETHVYNKASRVRKRLGIATVAEMEYPFVPQGGSGVYMDPTVIRSAAAVNSGIDALSVDPNFDIAELPVKLELRYVIESKRAANGLDCPKIEYNSSPQYEELTPEEETRRKVRRQRNKVAASKCRLKRREHVKNLLKASEELESANSKLESDIACLNAEKEQLERMLDAHKCISKAEIGASRGPA